MDKTTEKFARYAAGLSHADLTPKAIHETKRCLVDSIGCALGAFNAAPVKAVRMLASQVTAKKPVTLIGTRIRTSPELAGFVNSTMIRYLDFSDDYSSCVARLGLPHHALGRDGARGWKDLGVNGRAVGQCCGLGGCPEHFDAIAAAAEAAGMLRNAARYTQHSSFRIPRTFHEEI